MSRAFVKERDDLPAAHPISRLDRPRYMTSSGMSRLRERMTALIEELNGIPADDVAQRDRLLAELAQVRAELDTAYLIPTPSGEVVANGTRIALRLEDGTMRRIAIVGDDEIDPASGRIGVHSPLAHAIVGLSVGQHAEWHRPAGDLMVTVAEIELLAS